LQASVMVAGVSSKRFLRHPGGYKRGYRASARGIIK
jgi:hypothetical protein